MSKAPIEYREVLKTRFKVLEDFNPSSTKQVQAYLRAKGYKVPVDRKTRKPTSGEEVILGLKAKHPEDPILPLIWEARKCQKSASYLAETYLGRDKRLHTEFTYLPDTGRLSSRRPNLQNIPAGKIGSDYEAELAQAIRSTIIPSPGMIFVEADWRGIEAALVAFFANDPDYARICAIDAHSYLASFKVGRPASLSWSDAELSAYLKNIKKNFSVEREICKRANHSDGYGIGVKHLAEVLGTNLKGAQEMKDLRDRAFPKVAQWKKDVRRLAHLGERLVNPFGYTRYFFDVYQPKYDADGRQMYDARGNAIMKEGREANEALAFLPQSTAAGMMRDTLVRLARREEHGLYFHLLITIHDSILVECPIEHEAITRRILKEEMEVSWRELNGLVIETDMKSGLNWAELH